VKQKDQSMKYAVAIIALMLCATSASAQSHFSGPRMGCRTCIAKQEAQSGRTVFKGNHVWTYNNQGQVIAHGIGRGCSVSNSTASGLRCNEVTVYTSSLVYRVTRR